jgi:hypothetical protein
MAKPKGAPKTGGRSPGTPNKKTAETQAAVEASGMTPLEYMLHVMRDVGEDSPRRLAAATAAAPYVHAKLSSIELTGENGGPMETITRVELVALTKE